MSTVVRYKELRLTQLRSFCQCVREKSYIGAARALGISHPVVWQQVRALERTFGIALLQRRGSAIEPTEDGTVFFELASEIVTAMDALEQAFVERRSVLPRTLRLAASSTVFNLDLPQVVADFSRRHPQIHVALSVHAREQIEDLIASGELDSAVISTGPVPQHNPVIEVEELGQRDWHLVLPSGHPLARRRQITPANIVGYPLILVREDGDWIGSVKAVLRDAGVLDQLKVALELNSAHTASRYVSLGLGIAIMPISRGELDVPNTCTRPLDHLFAPERLVALWRRGARPRPQARLFVDLARQHMQPR